MRKNVINMNWHLKKTRVKKKKEFKIRTFKQAAMKVVLKNDDIREEKKAQPQKVKGPKIYNQQELQEIMDRSPEEFWKVQKR